MKPATPEHGGKHGGLSTSGPIGNAKAPAPRHSLLRVPVWVHGLHIDAATLFSAASARLGCALGVGASSGNGFWRLHCVIPSKAKAPHPVLNSTFASVSTPIWPRNVHHYARPICAHARPLRLQLTRCYAGERGIRRLLAGDRLLEGGWGGPSERRMR